MNTFEINLSKVLGHSMVWESTRLEVDNGIPSGFFVNGSQVIPNTQESMESVMKAYRENLIPMIQQQVAAARQYEPEMQKLREEISPREQALNAHAFFGLRIPAAPAPDKLLADGQLLTIGQVELQVLHTPGHAPGHVSIYVPEYHLLFDGDVLFQGGIGRTDFPGGDYDLLIRTIQERILTLPDDTQVFSGHGPATTVGLGRTTNPFLVDSL